MIVDFIVAGNPKLLQYLIASRVMEGDLDYLEYELKLYRINKTHN